MAIESTTPVTVEGETYDKLAITLAISPVWKTGTVGGSVALNFTPYREDVDGVVHKIDQQKAVVYLDIDDHLEDDSDLAQAVYGIMTAIQRFIIAKGL